MRKEEFLERLEYLLSDVPREEREEALEFYRDYLEEAGSEHAGEAAARFGSPEKVAAEIKAGLLGQWKGEYTERGYHDERYREDYHVPEKQSQEAADGPGYAGAGREAAGGQSSGWKSQDAADGRETSGTQRAASDSRESAGSGWESWKEEREREFWGTWKERKTEQGSGNTESGGTESSGQARKPRWWEYKGPRRDDPEYGRIQGRQGQSRDWQGRDGQSHDRYGGAQGGQDQSRDWQGGARARDGQSYDQYDGAQTGTGRPHTTWEQREDGSWEESAGQNDGGELVKRQKSGLRILLFLLLCAFIGLPVAGSLIAAGFSVIGAVLCGILGVICGVIGLVVAAFAAAAGILVSGISMIGAGISRLSSPAVGLMTTGSGFLFLALSMLLLLLARWGCGTVIPWMVRLIHDVIFGIFRWIRAVIRRLTGRKDGKS